MTSPCIHGFTPEQCASCRTCPHGLESYRCGRCLTAATAVARRRPVPKAAPEQPLEEHHGFEIFWVPAVAGWQYRAPDSATSAESYRSVFLARKAIDGLASAPEAATASKRRK